MFVTNWTTNIRETFFLNQAKGRKVNIWNITKNVSPDIFVHTLRPPLDCWVKLRSPSEKIKDCCIVTLNCQMLWTLFLCFKAATINWFCTLCDLADSCFYFPMAFDHLAMCLAADASMFNLYICVFKHKVWKETCENHDGNKEKACKCWCWALTWGAWVEKRGSWGLQPSWI